mgnify:CR=1 FL=1
MVIPQITFAAWWNPFTWKIFYKTEKVSELENKLGDNGTTTIDTSTTKSYKISQSETSI